MAAGRNKVISTSEITHIIVDFAVLKVRLCEVYGTDYSIFSQGSVRVLH